MELCTELQNYFGENYMNNIKTIEKNHRDSIIVSFYKLLTAQEIFALGNIRKNKYMKYFFTFPLAMSLINIQDFIFEDGIGLFGLAHTTVTFMAFAIGAIAIFLFTNEKNIASMSKISALITILGFVPWLFISQQNINVFFDMTFMAGIGGCVSCSSFTFVFMLNNTERFFGSALMVLLIDLIELSADFNKLPFIIIKTVAIAMIITLCAFMLLSDKEDYEEILNSKKIKTRSNKFDKSIWLVLYIFFSYFIIRITGFYASAFQHPENSFLWGFLAFSLIFLCVLIQVILKRSIWIICNVFFLSSIMAHLMWYMKFNEIAYLFSELKEIGLLVSFYLIGCITNKFCDFNLHKILVSICIGSIGILYVTIDFIHLHFLIQPISVGICAIIFIIFLFLSPEFSQHLFFAEWSKELCKVNMDSNNLRVNYPLKTVEKMDFSIENSCLSPREKQVVELLLEGKTLKEVSANLGLTVSTVATYNKTLYKKLGINSRSELFLMFGVPKSNNNKK